MVVVLHVFDAGMMDSLCYAYYWYRRQVAMCGDRTATNSSEIVWVGDYFK